MKKSALCLTILLLITMVLSPMVSCGTQEPAYREKNPTQAPTVYTYDPDWTPMPAPTDDSGIQMTGNPYDYVNPDRLFNIGEWMEIDGMQYRLNSVEFTKKIDGIDPEQMGWGGVFFFSRFNYGEMVDSEGNLYADTSYIILNLDVKNETDEPIEAGFRFQIMEHEKDVKTQASFFEYGEMSKELKRNAKDTYYIFEPGDEVNITYYGTIRDEYIDNDMLYFYLEGYSVESVAFVEGCHYLYSAWVPLNKDKSEVKLYEEFDDADEYINPERLYNIGETAEMKGMTFRVNKVSMGKKLEGISLDRMRIHDYEKTIMDEEGTFISDSEYSRIYIRANVTIQNLTEQEIELCVGAIYLSVGGHAFPLDGASGVTPSMTEDLRYDDFYRFQPGEEVTFDIYYIDHDRQLTDDRMFIQFPIIMGLMDPETPPISYDAVSYQYDIFVPISKDKSEVDIYEEWHSTYVP